MKFAPFFCALSFFALISNANALPKIEHWTTPAGTRVYFVENHDLPILDVQIDFAAGSAYDPPEKAGLAALTHALLDTEIPGMDENKIAEKLADLGAILSGGVDLDRASMSLRTLSADEKRVPALELLRAVLSQPQFPPKIMEREKTRYIASLKEALTRPETLANRAFWAALYPQHAYGQLTQTETLTALRAEDLPAFYRAHYSASRATLSLVGDLSRRQAEALAKALTDDLPTGAGEILVENTTLPAAHIQRIDHPASQAHVLLGLPALKRGDPDFFALLVGNYTLGGGGFVSRLMHEVREKRGLAYSVQSYFAPLAQPGPFQIGLQTKKSQAEEALAVVHQALQKFLAEGPSKAEWRAAQQNLIGSFPLRLDSNRKILDNLSVIGFYGLPLDYLDRYTEQIEKVSIADIKAAFARHVKVENLITVIVGGNENVK